MVATANVQGTLPQDLAREVLAGVLDLAPDLVGLQEWGLSRYRILRENGPVRLVPGTRVRAGEPRTGDYRWCMPVFGGCVIGARTDRFDLVRCGCRLLSTPGRADRQEGRWGLEPPRVATVGVYHDRHRQQSVALLSYHLVYGVQVGGHYREDRPALVARHRAEVRGLQRLVDEQLSRGHVVYAVGDSNFDGLRLSGLTSAWAGSEDAPGTLGQHRLVDDVFGPGPAASVTLLSNASDHRAVLATRAD